MNSVKFEEFLFTFMNKWEELFAQKHLRFSPKIQTLIDRHSDWIYMVNLKGLSPLHCAVRAGNITLIKLLIQNPRVDIDANVFGAGTPLHIAIQHHQGPAAQVLINSGAKIDIANSSGITPLHRAVELNRKFEVELLLRAEVFTMVVDRPLKVSWSIFQRHYPVLAVTPLQLAFRRGNRRMVRILSATGGDIKFSNEYEPLPEETIRLIRFKIYFSKSLFAILLPLI